MLRIKEVQLSPVHATMVSQQAMLVVMYGSNCLSNDYMRVKTVANVIPSAWDLRIICSQL